MAAVGKVKVLAKVKAPVHLPVRVPNRPVVRPVTLQPALQVGAVNDPAEHEAEAMAARVVTSSAPAVPVQPNGSNRGQAAPARRSAEGQPNLDDLDEGTVPAEQADVTVAPAENVTTEGLEGKDLKELDSGKPKDTSGEPPAEDTPPIPDAPLPVAAALRRDETGATVGRMGGAAPQDVTNLVASPGPGRVLPRSVRQRIEPHFGLSFGDVRLHDSAADRRAARRIGARAFTHRNHIWLGDGESETNTRLMAHELTHVVQQTKGSEVLPLARAPVPVIRRGYFANKAESIARHVPGYTLITVLVGRKLISGDRVEMTAENLLGGFMGLIPGGTVIFDRLKEARVITEAFDWVKGKLGELNLTWSRIKSDLSEALDTLNPFKAARNVKNMVKRLVRDIVRFVTALAKKLLEFIVRGALKLAGPYAEKVWAILQRAGQTINLILEDPLGFAKNLVKAVVGGFKQFGLNIWEHLKKGLLGWLFGSLSDAGIELPSKLDFKGLLSIVLQILGLTYANFRARLVKKLGPKGEKMVTMLEKSVEVVKILLKEGFTGIWQKLLTMIDNFRQTMIGGLSEMIITSLVKAGIGWLAGLSNPVGAIIKVVLSIYNLITTFIERFQQIVDVCESIFNSVGAIARGQVKQATDFVEQTIGRTVPAIISFLAALIPVTGITSKIKAVIAKLRAPVTKAMDKLIDFLIKKAKKLFSKFISKVNKKRKYPSVNFKVGAKQHRIFAEKKGKKLVIKIASGEGKTGDAVEACHDRQMKLLKKAKGEGAEQSKAEARVVQAKTKKVDTDTDKAAKNVEPEAANENQLSRIETLQKELKAAGLELEAAAKTVDALPQISSQTDDCLFRAAEPRLEDFEGRQDDHAKLLKKGKTDFNDELPYSITSFYEMDHVIEKRFAKTVLENLPLIDPAKAKQRKDKKVQGSSDRSDRAGKFNAKLAKDQARGRRKGERAAGKSAAVQSQNAPPLGQIGKEIKRISETGPHLPAVAVYRHNHIRDKGLKDHKSIIEQARKKDDPHAHVKSSLKAQMNLEEKEMMAKVDADMAATKKIKSNMRKGIQEAKARNTEIFGLAGTRARRVKKSEKKERNHEQISSLLLFKGGNGAPNFLEKEGVGGPYGTLSGMTEHLERDHIIDKAYPKMAAAVPLLKPDEQEGLETQVRTSLKAQNKRMSAKRRQRLNAVKGAKLYPAGSKMAQYTDASGYAIPFYKPVAREITSATGGAISQSDLAGKASGTIADSISTFVIDGGDDKLAKARNTRADGIEKVLRDRTDAHVGHVKAAYEKQKGQIPSHQDPASQQAATAHMGKIIAQVKQSLAKARLETEQLF
ncbi:eCIS core domain-containing protein [Kordiimonas marina]|uniref:eCIS core domain-containing protein n=1 Tax=Kordiimonas marina TaxID=2872312 RepID=UPI001FF61BC7|nr:DUF4157 domain-containing protein [Kordiimonas marina]MCJ9429306.1 DUF4157 domain-containing protein [Kordiimonas marina]